MSEHDTWLARCRDWRSGRNSDETALRATAIYLEASANWVEVRDFLITMAMSKRQILDWFSEQDFPDFEEAVNEGWGWPEDEYA